VVRSQFLSSNLYGYINKKGILVIKPQFFFASQFSEGLAAVRTNSGFGYIDKSGRMIVAPRYQFGKQFSEGLAAVRSFSYPWKWGYINDEGTMVIAPKYDDAGSFKNGKAWVVLDGRQGSIDKNGRFVPDKFGYSPNYISPSEHLMADLYLAAMKEAYKIDNGGNGFIAVDTDTLYGLGPAGKQKIMNELKSLSPNVYEYGTIKNDKTKFQFKDGIIVSTINGAVLSATINSYTGETATISAASWFGNLGAAIPIMEASLENGVWKLRVKRVAMV